MRAACAEECVGVGGEAVGGCVERDEECCGGMEIVKGRGGCFFRNGADEIVLVVGERGLHVLPEHFFLRLAAGELRGVEKALISVDALKAAFKTLCEFAAEIDGRSLAGEGFDEGALGKLIILTAPVFDPA